MGENVLRAQVKEFMKGRDKSLKGLAVPTLFDRPDTVDTLYIASPVSGRAVCVGDTLHGHPSVDGEFVNLANGHVTVGRIEGEGAKALVDRMLDAGGIVWLPMKVVEVSPVSGFIKATLKEGGHDR